jgi:alkylated DNA repair dioxygenase AlkB
MPRRAAPLFEQDAPSGFQYRPEFISEDEESALIAALGQLTFSAFEMRGVVARRRVAFFGRTYDAGGATTSPLPEFMTPLRDALAGWAGLEPEAFAMALVNQYPAGAPIGWHRDAPQYAIVAGLSLLSPCRMTFRPYVSPSAARVEGTAKRTATHEAWLERRSAYLLSGEARSGFEHHIPAVTAPRYSITFRTIRS